jgi:hypothetical protein
MKHITSAHIALISLVFTMHASGQSDPRLQVLKGWVIPQPTYWEELYQASEKRAREGVFDPRAGVVLKGAESFTKAIFTFSGMEVRHAATYTHLFNGPFTGPNRCETNYDTLLAEWAVTGPAGSGTLTLEDNPIVSVYTLRVPARAIVSRDDLTTFLAGILVDHVEAIPLRLGLADITFSAPPGPGIAAFFGEVSRSPNAFIWEVDIAGVVRQRDAYLYVRVTKDIAEKYYHLPPFVPERFPPLAELARGWSFDRLRSEVGEEGCSQQREVVLLTELAKRDLTADQFIDLLVNTRTGDSRSLLLRATYVLLALKDADRMAVLEKYLEPALETYAKIGERADEAALHLFRVMGGNCSPGFEALALKHIEGTYPIGAIWYLGLCSTSSEALRRLEELKEPGGGGAEVRARAVDSIRRRMGKPPADKR